MDLSDIGLWDLVLVLSVSSQVLVLSRMSSPLPKALVLTLPFPFTMAALAVDREIDPANVLGLILLLLFIHGVRWLHASLRLPIIASIVYALSLYCVIAGVLADRMPRSDSFFWLSCLATVATGGVVYWRLPLRLESAEPASLPLWKKIPLVVLVVCGLVMTKNLLQGFVTVFPMVTVVGLYECRDCLWTVGRHAPIILLTMLPMIVTVYLVQNELGLHLALVVGWGVFLLVYVPLTVSRWREEQRARGAV